MKNIERYFKIEIFSAIINFFMCLNCYNLNECGLLIIKISKFVKSEMISSQKYKIKNRNLISSIAILLG